MSKQFDVEQLLRSCYLEAYATAGGTDGKVAEQGFQRWLENLKDDIRASLRAPKELSVNLGRMTII